MPVAHGIPMHFEAVRTILQIVSDIDAFSRQFFGFAHGYKTCTERIRQRGSKDEPASFYAEYDVNLGFRVVRLQSINDIVKAFPVFEQRGDVVEENARLGKIGNFAD